MLRESIVTQWRRYTGNTQKNGAVSIVFTVDTAPFVCVCTVYLAAARNQNSSVVQALDRRFTNVVILVTLQFTYILKL
jgi:hypothetical protein